MNAVNRIISISFSKINFTCPYCDIKYNDDTDKYLDRCNKNKYFMTTIKCSCGNKFGFTYDITGQAVGFKL